eukprot:COSAG01_NODE_461_length_16698_cov_113.458160_3_plen_548_part_00
MAKAMHAPTWVLLMPLLLQTAWHTPAVAAAARSHAPTPTTPTTARLAVGPKLVFGHYMLCFQAFSSAYPNPTHSARDVQGYMAEMALAQRHGVDGFALEYGFSHNSQPLYNASLHWMFEACEEYNTARGATASTAKAGGPAPFHLIPMLDFDAGNTSAVAEVLLRHIDSPCQYRFQDRAVLSNWRGGIDWDPNNPCADCAQASQRWEAEVVAPLAALGHSRPFYIPYIITMGHPASAIDTIDVLSNWSALDGFLFWGCSYTGEDESAAGLRNLQACRAAGKYAMNPVSGPVSSHTWYADPKKRVFNRYFPPNGAKAITQEWMANIEGVGGLQPDWVIFSTWNDVGEHHYVGPMNNSYWGAVPAAPHLVTHTDFPHMAYLELSSYFIKWYKSPAGSGAPVVAAVDEAVFYFYNLQPVGNPCPLDQTGPDTIHATAEYPAEDAVYVTSLLAEPATLTITTGLSFTKAPGRGAAGFTIPRAGSGPVNTTFALPAGLHAVHVPALQGGQMFTVSRGGAVVATVLGSEGINTTAMSAAICNKQTFSGVIRLS